MSHELVLVLISSDTQISKVKDVVDGLVRPHSNIDDEDKFPYRCDGWTIGGRFDGQIYGAPAEHNLTPAEFQKRYGLDVVRQEPNIRPIKEIPSSFFPEIDSLLLPNGTWSSRVDEGYRANPDKWSNFVQSTLREYADRTGVVVDVHL